MQWFHTLGPNGMSGARAAFEQKLNGPMVPQAGARDRMVPFDGTICGYKLFEQRLLQQFTERD